MESKKLLRFTLFLSRWLLVTCIWFLWLIQGLHGAWWLHHQVMWHNTFNDFIKSGTYAIVSDPTGQASLFSFSDIEQGKLISSSPHPPTYAIGKNKIPLDQVSEFVKSHNLHHTPVSIELTLLDSDRNSSIYQIKTRHYGSGEWIWRYSVQGQKINPLKWYEIHDTAGIILMPMALLFWGVGIPIALWLSRFIFRTSRRILDSNSQSPMA